MVVVMKYEFNREKESKIKNLKWYFRFERIIFWIMFIEVDWIDCEMEGEFVI